MHRNSAAVSSSSDDGSSSENGSSSSSSFPKGSCVVTESDACEIHVVLVAARHAPKARVVRVCPTSGALLRVKRPRGWGNDEEEESVFFASDLDALTYLKELGKVKNATRGTCVLGIARLGDQVAALVATKVQKAMRLPTGEDVFRICETKWIKTTSISSPVRQLTEQEKEHARALMDFPIDGLHFYSETFDLRKSLAFRDSSRSSSLASPPPKEEEEEESEWVWNEAIAKPLRDVLDDDASRYVPVMIQGLAECREILVDATDPKKGSWHFAVFGKRSRLHPGTRFLARGINEDGNPGNEVEMEQMVWRSSNGNSSGRNSGRKKTIWTSYVWRRGSVPLRWKQEIKQTVGDAQIEVETKDTYKNAERYFARLRKSYGECNPIACVNLLRIAPGKPEAELSRHFHECVELCRNILPNDPNLTVTNFDWHTNVKSMGDASAVEAMWKVLRDKIGQHGYGYGTFDEATGEMITLRKQAGVLRYNCADSLDRTNLAGFFVAVQLLAEQTKRLGLADVLTDPESNSLQSTKLMERAKEDQFLRSADEDLSARLPEGWESRLDTTTGRTFYIDHNMRSTSWALPDDFVKVVDEERKERQTKREAILQKRKDDAVIREKEKEEAERKLFDMDKTTNVSEHSIFPSEQDSYVWLERTVDTLRVNMSRAALSAASEVYLQNGDLHALIYTSTRASHTAMMHLLDSTTSHDSNSRFKSSQSTASNLSISVQRRFVNLVSDGFRQTQFELFLGLRRKYYFPSLVQDPLEEKGRVVKSRAAFGALLAAPRCAINLVQNGEMLTEESFFLGEESGLSETNGSSASSYGNESNGNDKVAIGQFFKSVWPCPRSSRSESLTYEVREFGDQVDSSGGVENWLLLTDPKGANERFAPGRVRVTFLSASRKKKFSIVLKLPIIPTHATMALPLVECAGPFDAEEGVWKYSYKRLDRNFEDVEFYEQEGGIAREHQNEITPSSESATSKIKLTFEPRTVGTSPSALALTMALGRVEILGGDDGASISDKDIVGTLSPEDEAYLEQNFTLDAYERVAVEIVEHANTQDFEDRLNANLMLEILRLRLRLTSKFRDAKFTNLRNVDPEKLDPTTMLRTRRARRILENLRLQKENPVKHSAVGNATNASQSVGNVSLKSSTTDKTTSGATYFPEEAQTLSRSKTPILGGALTSSASLTSVATAAASKFAGFANSLANTAGSKLSGSLKDSTAAMEGLSISNKNETGRGDSIHSGGGGGSHSSPEKMVSHNIVPISPVLLEKKRLDDENERRVLTKLSVLRDLAISLDESADVLSHSASFGNASAARISQEFGQSPSSRLVNDTKSDDTAEAILEELKSRSRVKRERVKDVAEETPDDAHFLTLRGRHIYCAVAFTATKGSSRKLLSVPGSPSTSSPSPPTSSPTIEVDGFKFMPPPIPVLSSISSSSSSLFWCLRVSSFRNETLDDAEHIGDFRIPLLKNAPRTQLAFDFDGGRKSAFAFVFELACADAASSSESQTTYHSLHSRVQMFRYVPAE